MTRNVLIVDDEEVNRLMLSKTLSQDYFVLEAANGEEALRILESDTVPLSAILLDIIMPGINGYDVLSSIQKNPVWSQIPVIVCTGLSDVEMMNKALELGAYGITQKPYNVSLLKNTVRNAIRLCEAANLVNIMRYDKLTGLYNRETFFAEAEDFIHSQEPGFYVLCSIDIDSFKVINDQYGTDKGDAILKYTADCISDCASMIGGLACRFMADSFALLYPASYMESMFIFDAHKKTMSPPCLDHQIRIRIGRYLVDDLSISISSMYDRAALAQEKIKGHYDVYIKQYDESIRHSLLREQEIVNVMYDALNNHQFVPWFQPQYNHATGAVIGAEALVRWKKPNEESFVSPGEFIPIFERNGFVYEIDKFMWEQAASILRKWIDEGHKPLPISVNISRHDFFHFDFYPFITGLIKKYHIPVDLLRLEVTESAFSTAPEQIAALVKKLVSFGFTIEIDDFGSGYSSLNTLKEIPADILKLDMRFMSMDGDSERGGTIIESIVRMAKWLDMSVIAEGVELKEQADFLKSIGCYYIQGYYYAKPMPLSDYEALLEHSTLEPERNRLETVESYDNSAFWNPKSMDTLIFNSYVGGASIFEFCNNHIEVLRVTDRYRQEFKDALLNGMPVAELSPEIVLDAENLKILYDNVFEAIESRKESTCEVKTVKLDGEEGLPFYLKCTVRIIAKSEERYLCYSVLQNITALRLAEQNERIISEHIRAIMDNVKCGITAVSMHGDHLSSNVFVNDEYYAILGYTSEQYRAEVKNHFALINPEDAAKYTESICSLTEDGQTGSFKLRAKRRDGREIWLRIDISVIHFENLSDSVQLSCFTDITDEVLAEQNKQEVDNQLRFLNTLAGDLLSQPDIEVGILDIMKKMKTYFLGERVSIFEIDEENKVFSNTYEVCSEESKPAKGKLQKLPLEHITFWLHLFDEKCYIKFDDSTTFEGRPVNVKLFKQHHINAVIGTSVRRNNRTIGYIAICNPQRNQNHADHLASLGDFVSVMLTRRDLNQKILNDNQALVAIMNGIPGGFSRKQILSDGTVKSLYYSEGYLNLTDMTTEELLVLSQKDSFGTVHPDDVPLLKKALADTLKDGVIRNLRCRLCNKKKGFIPVYMFARVRRSDTGETYLNVFITDATEQITEEKRQNELLDNLPCGAALFHCDQKNNITIIHMNKHYWELAEMEPLNLAGLDVLQSVYPDDRVIISGEVNSAIHQNRDIKCDVRLLCGENLYRPFHIEGRFVANQDGSKTIYTSLSLQTDAAMSYQEMLPVALSTMMSCSTDFAFVKDKSLHYVCCSESTAELFGLDNAEQIIGKNDVELFDTLQAEKYVDIDKEIIRTGKPITDFIELFTTKGSELRQLTTSKYPILDTFGNVIGVYGIGRDITEEKEKEMNLKLLAETIPGGLASYESVNGKPHLIYCNENFYEGLGYTKEEYLKETEEDPLALIFLQDRSKVRKALESIRNHIEQDECTYRCHTKHGGYRWFSMKGVLVQLQKNDYIINCVKYDITQQKETEEQLRLYESQYLLALEHSGNIICHYDINSKIMIFPPKAAEKLGLPDHLGDMPDAAVRDGFISSPTQDSYYEFYHDIFKGVKEGTQRFQGLLLNKWCWLEAHFSTLFSDDNKPVAAVIAVKDVTEQCEREAIYRKWQQSLDEKADTSYTLFCCNISQNGCIDSMNGSLLSMQFQEGDKTTFTENTERYVNNYVYPEDRSNYLKTLNIDTLLAEYYRGNRTNTLEYRELVDEKNVRWLRRTVEMVEYPNSTDVMVYLMFEDINAQKLEEIKNKTLAETDPLTGLLNRMAFMEKAANILRGANPNLMNAFIMLDLDNFKDVNDHLGHIEGDKLLIEVGQKLRYIFQSNDLICRLGGDEFILCICDVPKKEILTKRAQQICSTLNKNLHDIHITASVGIAINPQDGSDFEELYHKVDVAMYYVKNNGKNNYTYYLSEMESKKVID